ncbi:MAG: glycosyltransferase family 4 protein [Bacillota bacterium]|jgi:UDP-GlcNAc:undecaprenyl-phosphate GlcNAc-1-phosphate transferase|nr:undecaprenyl/decaprenyl-phosphate alpha-N-acetylglucosaminyl 1-phosphate transferase [Candidatus Fermentithermobacillaceae bacterium]
MKSALAFGLAFALSFGLTPLVRLIAKKTGAMCYPNSRSIHRSPVPYLGGIAIYLASVIAMLATRTGENTAFPAVAIGGLVILIVGVIDDLWPLKPWQKFIGQVVSAGVVVSLGVSISFIKNPFSGEIVLIGVIALPLTILWIVSFENLINWSDGLDGLAAGIVGITSAAMVRAISKAGAIAVAPEAAALAGAVFGFLPFNFHPASIFMGDAGAMYLGLALSVLAVQGLVKSAVAMSILAPILTLMVPISDMAFSILRRKISGRPASQADRDHLHHRLLELGMSQRQAVLSIYVVSLCFGILGLVSGFVPLKTGAPLAGLAVLGMFVVAHRAGLLSLGTKKTRRDQGREG